MARWKTGLAVGIFGVTALVALGALYVRSQVKDSLEQMIALSAPVADVTYSGVTVLPSGKVRIAGIVIRPRVLPDNVTVENVEIQTPGLGFLLWGKNDVQNGKFPEKIHVAMRGLAIDLDGALARQLDSFAAAAAEKDGAVPLSNCGDVRSFDLAAYRKLGYTSLIFDFSAGYWMREQEKRMDMDFEFRMRDIGVVTLNADVSGTWQDAVQKNADIRNFKIVYKDLSLTDKIKTYCTQASGASVEQYIDSEIARSDLAFRTHWGFTPGPGVREAYRAFLAKPGEVVISGSPAADMEMATLAHFKPDDIVAMLGLRASVNGQNIDDLSLIPNEESDETEPATAAAVPASSSESAIEPQVAVSAPAPSERVTPAAPADSDGYRVVPTSELTRHVGQIVRLSLVQGVVREGDLLQVRDGVARLERRYSSGSMTFAIRLKEINRAEVLDR
jgi:hypothetical protein